MNTNLTLPSLSPEINSLRLGLYCADFSEAYSFVRCAGPFETMSHEDRRLSIIRPPLGRNGEWSLTWDWILQCDALYFFHPLFDVHLHCMATARRLGRAVWVEIVDDILNVPAHSPIYQIYKDRRWVREQITSAIDLASVVTVTSQGLKDALVAGCDLDSTRRPSLIAQPTGKVSDKIVVIPEAAFYDPDNGPRKKCISWRGLGTHDEDTAGVLPQVCAVARDFRDWEWVLFGNPAREFVEQLTAAAGPDRVSVAPLWPTPLDMIEAWRGCAPYLHLVPLADNVFNRGKSHLAWLEATAVGAAVIAPDYLPEWRQPGVLHYSGGVIEHNGKLDLEAVLRRELIAAEDGRWKRDEKLSSWPRFTSQQLHPNVQTARWAIYPHQTLAAMNVRRWAVLNKLAGAKTESRKQKVEMELQNH